MTRIIAILVLVSSALLAPDRISAVQDQGDQDRADRTGGTKDTARPIPPHHPNAPPPPPPPRARADDRRRGGDPPNRRFGPPWRPSEQSNAPREFGRWDRTDPREFTLDDERKQLILDVVNDLRPLSEQDRERLLAMPDADLRKLLTGDASRIFYLSRLRQYDPELYTLKIRELRLSQELVRMAREYRHLRAAGSAKADVVRATIRTKVVEQYDIRLATREHEIAQLERRIESMRARVDEGRSQRETIVEQWMAELDTPLDATPTSDSAEKDKKPTDRNQ